MCGANSCLQCLYANYNLSKCKVELQHLQPNGTVIVSIGSLDGQCKELLTFKLEWSQMFNYYQGGQG